VRALWNNEGSRPSAVHFSNGVADAGPLSSTEPISAVSVYCVRLTAWTRGVWKSSSLARSWVVCVSLVKEERC